MEHPGFFERAGPFPLADIAKAAQAEIAPGANAHLLIDDVRSLGDAARNHISFIDNKKYLPQLETTSAGACFVNPALASRLPRETLAVVSKQPYHAFARALALFYPTSMQPLIARAGAPPIDPTADLEDGVEIEPGVIIGPQVQIGRGSRIAAGAVIGARCTIGRDCYVGALATVSHAIIGDRVVIHSGVRIGQDGFGYALGRNGHLKVPQIGRVIIQDDVDIGANSTVDRGALKDTIIGEGTKIDNLVQIAHNVVVGRNCILVAMSGVSGSSELGDFVIMGGKAGVVGHTKIGAGAQIGGASNATHDVPAGARYFGTPAKPIRQAAREFALLKRLVERDKEKYQDAEPSGDDQD